MGQTDRQADRELTEIDCVKRKHFCLYMDRVLDIHGELRCVSLMCLCVRHCMGWWCLVD